MTYLATNVFLADGATTFWDFSFAGVSPDSGSGTLPYLYASDVKALELYKDSEGNAAAAERIVTIDPALPLRANIAGLPIAAGRQVKIYRSTEIRFPLVDYRDRQTVSEFDLDLANRQAIFVSQETQDAAQSSLALDKNENYDVNNRRIVNLAPGVADSDAVNMAQHLRSIRVSQGPSILPVPGTADQRAGKILSFDILGNPVATFPESGSAAGLELELANSLDPLKGAAKVAFLGGGTVADLGYLKDGALGNTTDPAKGAALVGRGGQWVGSIAELRTILSTTPSKHAHVVNHTAGHAGGGGLFECVGIVPGSVDDNGYTIVAADGATWLRRPKNPVINIMEFGARSVPGFDSGPAIQAAYELARSRGQARVDHTNSALSNFWIGAPLKLCHNTSYEGSARILPLSSFTSEVTFDVYGSVTGETYTYNCLAYFNEDTMTGNPANFGYSNIRIGRGLVFDAGYLLPDGIIIEGSTNNRIGCQVTQFTRWGIDLRNSCWGSTVDAYVYSVRGAFVRLGQAANAINLTGFRGYGLADTPDAGILLDGDNNGVSGVGGLVEKTKIAFHCIGGTGPVAFVGWDVEITEQLLVVDGSSTPARVVGPVSFISDFAEATVACFTAINAHVHVAGCRIRNTPVAFKATGGAAIITHKDCRINESVDVLKVGNVCGELAGTGILRRINGIVAADTPMATTYGIENREHYWNEELPTSGLDFKHSIQDSVAKVSLGRVELFTTEAVNGATIGKAGIAISYEGGAPHVYPLQASTAFGSTGANRYGAAYVGAFSTKPGVGVGVNPTEIGELVFQFTQDGQVTIKGKGTDGVVRVANIAIV